MSLELTKANRDLRRLRDEGYAIEIQHGHLVLDSIPYVNGKGEVKRGRLITELTLAGGRTTKPGNHQVWFVGEMPHTAYGRPLTALGLAECNHPVFPGVVANFRFSNKPPEGYADHHHKNDPVCRHFVTPRDGASSRCNGVCI